MKSIMFDLVAVDQERSRRRNVPLLTIEGEDDNSSDDEVERMETDMRRREEEINHLKAMLDAESRQQREQNMRDLQEQREKHQSMVEQQQYQIRKMQQFMMEQME